MKRVLTSFIFNSLSLYLSAQSIHRIEIRGTLLSGSNDVEAVTIFNTLSKKGTITNEKGEFIIEVALHDTLEISALQFQTVSITIDANVIKAKQLKIQLIERVNQLDAVKLSSGLSGNLITDVTNVKTVRPIHIDMGNTDIAFEYNDEKAFDKRVVGYHYKSIINPDDRNYLPDPLKIIEFLFKVEVPNKINLFSGKKVEKKPKELLDVYSHKYINETFNIPTERVKDFIAFVEVSGINPNFFMRENEILLIEFLIKQSETFLKLQNVKN